MFSVVVLNRVEILLTKKIGSIHFFFIKNNIITFFFSKTSTTSTKQHPEDDANNIIISIRTGTIPGTNTDSHDAATSVLHSSVCFSTFTKPLSFLIDTRIIFLLETICFTITIIIQYITIVPATTKCHPN